MFPYCTFWKADTLHSPYARTGEFYFSSLRWISINYLEFFCTGDLYPTPPAIYWCTQSFSVWITHFCFILWVRIWYYFNFWLWLKVFSQRPFSALSVGPCLLLICSQEYGFIFKIPFLLRGVTQYSSLIFFTSSPSPRSSYFSKKPLFFFLVNSLRNKELCTSVFIAMSILLSKPSQ